MSRLLIITHEETRRAFELQAARIAVEVGEPAPIKEVSDATAAGDPQRLRGIPALSRGVGSAMRGTNPQAALEAKQPKEDGWPTSC